jgi:hypothetical protein
MLFASPRHGRKLKDLSAVEFLTAAEQLFEAILDAFRRRVLHRDVSINNILLGDNQLLLVDRELGGHFEELSSAVVRGTVTGTLVTMSVASLRNDNPLPHDDMESAVYVLLNALTQTFVPPVDQQREWVAALRRYKWDEPLDPSMLADLWEGLWTSRHRTSTIPTTLRIFESVGYEARAQLVQFTSLPPSACQASGRRQPAFQACWYQQRRLRCDPLVARGSREDGV